ncbi:metalloregulator ArsR/SmtB family transcription factor [Lentilactobacillus hilgardii]|uniref:Metalloregulator ArsR/SmtB family transcription factor n=2 Tax=Lentilactobacillus hilgardii TaxID=1588 RepID=A0A6P1EBJ4_LENHI|nr:transcriptional regulator, ArsR family [Lentilactobacillus hilgardii ATCC 27305]MCT3391766.1 ArsR family transcriptional regulator [Lentilactobacillus hilgardii]QHB52123.1 metalloregulator ArsR/SmtB family transcription factor [Lentilactobacillus hilgardii]RRG12040.1 MAG: ArsR family transcriptional regulator [Lactobacillus sp.]
MNILSFIFKNLKHCFLLDTMRLNSYIIIIIDFHGGNHLTEQDHKQAYEQMKENGIPLSEHIDTVTTVFKVIADQTRMRILLALSETSLSVNEIADILTMSQSSISHQLRVLKDNRLVKGTRLGKQIHYQLTDDHIVQIFKQIIEHIEEKKQHHLS